MPDPMAWLDAKTNCKTSFGSGFNLASVHSVKENALLSSMLWQVEFKSVEPRLRCGVKWAFCCFRTRKVSRMITVRFSWVASQLWTEVKSLSGLITQSSTWTTGQGTSLTRLVILRMKIGNTSIRKTFELGLKSSKLQYWRRKVIN